MFEDPTAPACRSICSDITGVRPGNPRSLCASSITSPLGDGRVVRPSGRPFLVTVTRDESFSGGKPGPVRCLRGVWLGLVGSAVVHPAPDTLTKIAKSPGGCIRALPSGDLPRRSPVHASGATRRPHQPTI